MKATTGKKMVLALFALAAMSSAVWAQGSAIFNYSGGMQRKVMGTLDDGSGTGSVETRFWAVGNAAAQNSGLSRTTSHLLAMGPDSYEVWTDWTAFNVIGPPPLQSNRTAVLYSIENGGQGQFILMSVAYDDVVGGYDFGQVTNGNMPGSPNQEIAQYVPPLTVQSVLADNSGLLVTVSWNALSNLSGFYDTAPLENLVTGVAVRYQMGYDAPLTHRTAECKLAGNGFVDFGTMGADPGTAQVHVPMPSPGMNVFLALSLLFDNAQPTNGARAFLETAFLGETVALAAPAEVSPVFRAVSARSVRRSGPTVSWSMRQEGSVNHYVVYGATSETGSFQRISSDVSANGGLSGRYQAFTSMASARFVRVDAVLNNSRTVSSSVVAVSR